MMDVYTNEMEFKNLQETQNGYRIMFKSDKNNEMVSVFVSPQVLVDLYGAIKRRLEVHDLIPKEVKE